MQRRSVLKGAALLEALGPLQDLLRDSEIKDSARPSSRAIAWSALFSVSNHIHMTEPYHGLMAKQWLKALLDASTPR